MSVLVSILIPAHHSALTIRAALKSCISQTYRQIEIIVLNTGSTDHTSEVVRDIKDERIQLHENSENKGIAAARNHLLKLAKGEFIAWLDADDEMMPERIERQLAYFGQFPETDIAGTWIKTDYDELPERKVPTTHHEIYHYLWFKNCMIQPSIMSRNFYAKEGIFYDESFANTAEDYEFWYRLRDKKHFANIPEFLTKYHMTIGADLERKKKAGNFDVNLKTLWQKKWEAVKADFNDKQRSSFIRFLYNNDDLDTETTKDLRNVLDKLRMENTDQFYHLILNYHQLRLWRNMGLSSRIRYCYDLRYLSHWSDFKKHYLI